MTSIKLTYEITYTRPLTETVIIPIDVAFDEIIDELPESFSDANLQDALYGCGCSVVDTFFDNHPVLQDVEIDNAEAVPKLTNIEYEKLKAELVQRDFKILTCCEDTMENMPHASFCPVCGKPLIH
jgi:NADH pyrophosphatase NudC (nudix superfamily)